MMAACRCEMCCPENPDPKQTRAYALECEAREVLRWPLHARRDYLDRVEQRRGLSARVDLEGAMRRELEGQGHGETA